MRGDEPAGTEAAAIRYFAGFAALQYARSLREDDKDQAALRTEYLSTARRTLAAAAQRPGPCQSKAKALLADPLLRNPQAKAPPPAGFAEARDRGNAALDRMAVAESELEAAGSPGREPGDSGPLTAEIVAARQEAIRCYTLALDCPARNSGRRSPVGPLRSGLFALQGGRPPRGGRGGQRPGPRGSPRSAGPAGRQNRPGRLCRASSTRPRPARSAAPTATAWSPSPSSSSASGRMSPTPN